MKQVFKWLRNILIICCLLFVSFITLDILQPLNLTALSDISKVIKDKNGKWLYITTNSQGRWHYPPDIKRLDPQFIKFLLIFEDKRFYSHFGIDPIALFRALISSIRAGKIVSGGSTITMQLARLLEPKSRTIGAKLIEMFRALQLEWHYDKSDILSWYLSKTPYGGNIEGVEAASRIYFAKSASSLTPAQAALLTAIPQSPEKLRPDKHPLASRQARDRVINLARFNHLLSETAYLETLAQDVPQQKQQLPRYAPHLAQHILSTQKGNIFNSTIDIVLQEKIQTWAKKSVFGLDKDVTISTLIVRNRDSAIMAYLGSHDMYNQKSQGFVDMVQAIRSPGSTLKPLIYAMAFDQHLIHPQTLINDYPTNFRGYTPGNFNHQFKGNVTVTEALKNSLNIPAVLLLNQLKADRFINEIEKVCGKLIISDKKATLPIALGGVGISMAQLLNLYANIANGGTSFKLKFSSSVQNQANKLFSPKAMRQTIAIMRQTPAPLGYLDQQDKIAFKTGTSYGYRDAWAIGFNRDYSIAVWMGKPTGASHPKHTGRNSAAPLLFELFSLLQAQGYKSTDWGFSPSDYLAQAPVGLKKFDPLSENINPKISWLSPPKEAMSYQGHNCKLPNIAIRIKGGKAPYQWYIDNEPLAQTKPHWQWQADQPGAHNLTVIDSSGGLLSRNLWISDTNCTQNE